MSYLCFSPTAAIRISSAIYAGLPYCVRTLDVIFTFEVRAPKPYLLRREGCPGVLQGRTKLALTQPATFDFVAEDGDNNGIVGKAEANLHKRT